MTAVAQKTRKTRQTRAMPAAARNARPHVAPREVSQTEEMRAARSLRVGKKLPGAVYVHVSALGHVGPVLQEAVAHAMRLCGLGPDDHAFDLVKFNVLEPTLSLLSYPGFDAEPFPGLRESWSVNLQTDVVKHRSYPQGPTTPILHRKETFLAPGDERIPAWAALTRSLEDLGLFRETASIGTRRKWDARLASEDVQVLPDHTVRRGPRGRTNPSRGACRRPSRRGPAYAAPRWNPAVEPARAYSPGTSIKQIPALHKALAGAGVLRPGSVNADIGGGRFDDATVFLADHGVTSLVYDPGNRSEAWNRRVLEQVEDGRADSATIANVLNVIPDPGVRAAVLRLAANVVRPGGPVFVGVYEGDGKGNGRETSKGWQENRKLASYLPEVLAVFPDASIRTLGGLRMIAANMGAPAGVRARPSKGVARGARSNPTTSRYERLVRDLEARGADDPRALAAAIGRRKYGPARFAAMSAAGRRRATSRRGGHQ